MKGRIVLAMFGNSDDSRYAPAVSALQILSEGKLTWETGTARLFLEYNVCSKSTGTQYGKSYEAATNSCRPRALR